MSLVFYFFIDLVKACLTSDHVTTTGYPYTCLPSTHTLLLFICWGDYNTQFIRIQRVHLYTCICFLVSAILHTVNNFFGNEF